MPNAPSSAPRLEKSVQAEIREALSVTGYEYLETGVPKRAVRCPNPKCGQRFTPSGGNNAPGVPDLLVWRRGWGAGILAALEVKGPTTRLSDKQRELFAADRIYIVRSAKDALCALLNVEAAIQGCPMQRQRLARFIAQLDGGKAVSHA